MYCTKCEKDYPDDQTICPECGNVLVEKAQDDESENQIPVASESEGVASRIKAFFQYSGLECVQLKVDKTTGMVRVLVNESDYRKAVKLLNIYNLEEQKKELASMEPNPLEEEEAEEEILYNHDNKVFIKTEDKYQELKSSASSLIVVGLILIAAEICIFFQIIQLNLNTISNILLQGIFSIMGIGFFLYGILSSKNAASMKSEIQEENERTEEIQEWFLHTYSSLDLDRDIDETLDPGTELEEADRQFRRLELIRTYICGEYDQLDAASVSYTHLRAHET